MPWLAALLMLAYVLSLVLLGSYSDSRRLYLTISAVYAALFVAIIVLAERIIQ